MPIHKNKKPSESDKVTSKKDMQDMCTFILFLSTHINVTYSAISLINSTSNDKAQFAHQFKPVLENRPDLFVHTKKLGNARLCSVYHRLDDLFEHVQTVTGRVEPLGL